MAPALVKLKAASVTALMASIWLPDSVSVIAPAVVDTSSWRS